VNRVARIVLIVAAALTTGGLAALAAEPTGATQPDVAAAPTTVVTVATTSTVAPATTTTAPPPPTTVAAPRTVTTAALPVVTTPRPVVTTIPVVRPPTGKVESCGWGWDATRLDDGSLNEVMLMLDAPRRPNEAVTIVASPNGPDSPAMSHQVMTDGGGQAESTFSIPEDKRDWSITISATFASGSACSAQSILLDY
jgi:hypothetical protein